MERNKNDKRFGYRYNVPTERKAISIIVGYQVAVGYQDKFLRNEQ